MTTPPSDPVPPSLRPLPPLDTAPLFPPLHAELIALLRSLEPADWERPTVAGAWRVRDVAAHLLDGELRTLSAHRDGHRLAPDGAIRGYADVMRLITRLNAQGVAFGKSLSPTLLVDLLEVSGRWMGDFVATLDPDAPALYAVAWAGETVSDNRFDTAREYTERWHHQMQMRDALGARGKAAVLLAPCFLLPLLETSLRALPHAYRSVIAPDGTALVLSLTGAERGAAWTLRREQDAWKLYDGIDEQASVRVEATPDALWRLFFNALPADRIATDFAVRGSDALLAPLWQARAVMV